MAQFEFVQTGNFWLLRPCLQFTAPYFKTQMTGLVQDRLIMKMAMEQKARRMALEKEEKVLTAPGPNDQIIRHLWSLKLQTNFPPTALYKPKDFRNVINTFTLSIITKLFLCGPPSNLNNFENVRHLWAFSLHWLTLILKSNKKP